jgi:hypothetical protein
MSGKWDRWYYFKLEPRRSQNAGSSDSSPLDILVPILGAGILATVGIIGWQIYSYLRLGEWQSLSIITALLWLNVDWARLPSDWAGVHKILDAIPLSLTALVAGIAPIGLWLWWDERSKGK